MNLKEYMIEGIKETLDENNEKLSEKCIADIAESVIIYYQNKELAFWIISHPVMAVEDVKRGEDVYKRRIAELEAREKIYIDNICRRRNVEPRQIEIEDGDIIIYADK